MGCPALRLELRRNRLVLCYYLALKCPQHGEMRAAVKRVPDGSYHCPLCRVVCGWTLLGADALDPDGNLVRTRNSFINDSRQFFVKVSYLFRF